MGAHSAMFIGRWRLCSITFGVTKSQYGYMRKRTKMISDIITEEFAQEVVRDFLQCHAEIAEDESVKLACKVLLEYTRIPE